MSYQKLRVFVSSRMQELAAERQIVKAELDKLHIDAWVFEQDAGARPETIQQTFLQEIEDADLFIGLYWLGYGPYTIEEYEHAQKLGRDCLLYQKLTVKEEKRDPRLQEFLDRLNDVPTGHTVRYFKIPEELSEYIKGDVQKWQANIIRKHKASGDVASLDVQSELKEIKEFLFKHLKVKTVSDALAVSVVEDEERSKVAALIERAEASLQEGGVGVEPDNYYLLGVSYLALSHYEEAKACFLAATEIDPELGKAYLGLGITYQLQANEMIRQENFGLAEDALNKAGGYVQNALHYDSTDQIIYVQLGYIHKDLAQRYKESGRHAQVQPHLTKAITYFKMALGVDENNAGAHNGLASICIVKGDYDGGIEECRKAIALEPKYLFAFFDLASAYYGKARTATNALEKAQALQRFVETYLTVVELDDNDPAAGSLPPQARQALEAYSAWVLHEIKDFLEKAQASLPDTSTEEGQITQN